MKDAFGRTIEYLRISVTEACNFECLYCAPSGRHVPASSPLRASQIEQVVQEAVKLGIGKIRLTGGEPLVRRDIVNLVRRIAAIEGVTDLSMTTNAFLLQRHARALREAGLDRVNISLDSLRRDRFERLVGQDAFSQVWEGVTAADAAGLAPLKINVVALRGLNDDEVRDFARLTVERPWHVRFIELMPVGTGEAARGFFAQYFIPAAELAKQLSDLEPISPPRGNGPARTYRLPGARGTIGFITPASQHFCQSCNRLRLTAQGRLRSCLFSQAAEDVTTTVHEASRPDEIRALLLRAADRKPECHPFGDEFSIVAESMSEIGG